MVRLLLVEDDLPVVDSLSQALRTEGYAVAHVPDGFSAISKVKLDPPDLLLLDGTLPDIDGVKVCRCIRTLGLDFPIVMMAGPVAQRDVVLGLDAGADDFVTKPFLEAELFARLRAATRRSPCADLSVLEVGEVTLDRNAHQCTVNGALIFLTVTEFDLLDYLMRNHGRTVKRSLVIREVWDTNWLGQTKNLDMHISTLRKKLGSAAIHLQTVRGVGYKFENVNSDSN